jgi:wobble nucleotide-excising tRNase
MVEEHNNEIEDIVDKLKQYIDQLNATLINDIPKEVHEANKQYRDLIHLAGEFNARLAKP